jgi:signal transduction histidine kinase
MSTLIAEPDHPRLLPAVLVPRPEIDPDTTRLRRTTRDWFVDTVAFVLCAGFGLLLFGAEEARAEVSRTVLTIDFSVGVVACLALWLRRRWPVGVAIALGLAGGISSLGAFAAAFALFTVAVHRPLSRVCLVALLTVPTFPLYLATHPDNSTSLALEASLAVLVTGGVIAWGMVVRARRQLVLSLRDRALRAESEQQLRVEQAKAAERARIAREMHDVLAHRISLLSLHAGALEFRRDALPDDVARAAGVIRDTAHEALEDLREVIGVLRDGDGSDTTPERPQPTLADVPELVDESRAAGMSVRLRLEELGAVPSAVGRNAYRVVQEGLTNARKHARGATVDVDLHGSAGAGLSVEVRNRLPVGQMPAEIPGAGTGIVGLAERVGLAGGRLEHGRTDDGDFSLRAWLPWPA